MSRFIVLPIVFLSFLIVQPIAIYAQSSKKDLAPIQHLEQLLRELEAIEREGRQILENQEAAIAEIESLKIWTRKR